MILISFVIFGCLLINTKTKELASLAVPFLAVLLMIGYLPLKYLLWNIYGQEHIIVNTKTVSNSYNYGILKTNLNIQIFSKLGTGYEYIRTSNEGEELGSLVFYDYSKETNLPIRILETTVLISSNKLKEIDDLIWELFYLENNLNTGFIRFSDN